MTENEAISELEKFQLQVEHSIAEEECCEYENPEEDLQKDKKFIDAFKTAISALEEIQQYREIGTVEECREAVEKQKPKKIIIEPYCPTECPTCGHELSTSLGDGYYKYPTFLKRCPNCGQYITYTGGGSSDHTGNNSGNCKSE